MLRVCQYRRTRFLCLSSGLAKLEPARREQQARQCSPWCRSAGGLRPHDGPCALTPPPPPTTQPATTTPTCRDRPHSGRAAGGAAAVCDHSRLGRHAAHQQLPVGHRPASWHEPAGRLHHASQRGVAHGCPSVDDCPTPAWHLQVDGGLPCFFRRSPVKPRQGFASAPRSQGPSPMPSVVPPSRSGGTINRFHAASGLPGGSGRGGSAAAGPPVGVRALYQVGDCGAGLSVETRPAGRGRRMSQQLGRNAAGGGEAPQAWRVLCALWLSACRHMQPRLLPGLHGRAVSRPAAS